MEKPQLPFLWFFYAGRLTTAYRCSILIQVSDAGLAHPVERLLPKQKVASSSLVTRSILEKSAGRPQSRSADFFRFLLMMYKGDFDP